MSSELTRSPDRLAMVKLRQMSEHEQCGKVGLVYLESDGLWECEAQIGERGRYARSRNASVFKAISSCHSQFLKKSR